MKDKDDNPYVHKFSRHYFRTHGGTNGEENSGIPIGLKIAGILMISCIAVPLLLAGISFIAGLF